MQWTPWRTWDDGPHLSPATLAETLDGGQAFRWNLNGETFEGLWGKHRVRIRAVSEHRIAYSLPEGADPGGSKSALERYFAAGSTFDRLADALPWRSDPVLRTAMDAFPGLRILRQPLGETLFGFLCSSTKKIPQIKAACEAVATDIGQACRHQRHALPGWPALAAAGESRLRAAKLGYRARYVHATAVILNEQPELLEHLPAKGTEEAREILMRLPGVGRKIADCVLLFGLGRLEVFPVDTWILRVLEESYGLQGWNPDQLQQFARAHFGDAAGLAQQYLFAASRAGLI